MAEEADKDVKARKEREKDELYALDISDVAVAERTGHGGARGAGRDRLSARGRGGHAVVARPGTVLRYTEAEWRAFVLGARDGEFDLEPAPHVGGLPAE